MRRTYKKVNYIFLTEFNKKKIMELNNKGHIIIDDSKTYIKPNFVNIDREVMPFEKRKNQFIFVGRLDKLKGINILLEAWKEIKESDLIICGTGPEAEWCKTFIAENGLLNVSMRGFVDNDKIMDLIAESKALILPTQWYEGFPMTIVESLACGTPVIGSNIGNVGSLIEDGKTGIRFEFDSSGSVIEAVRNLSDMTESCGNVFRNNYHPEINYQLLLSIYENIITSKKTSDLNIIRKGNKS